MTASTGGNSNTVGNDVHARAPGPVEGEGNSKLSLVRGGDVLSGGNRRSVMFVGVCMFLFPFTLAFFLFGLWRIL